MGATLQLWCLFLPQSMGSKPCRFQQLQRMGSAVAAPGFQSVGSVVMEHRLSCPAPCGIFPWTVACQAFLSFTISQSLVKLMSTELVIPSNHFTLCHPLLLLPQFFPASGSFPASLLFASVAQSIRASTSTSVPPMNIQG